MSTVLCQSVGIWYLTTDEQKLCNTGSNSEQTIDTIAVRTTIECVQYVFRSDSSDAMWCMTILAAKLTAKGIVLWNWDWALAHDPSCCFAFARLWCILICIYMITYMISRAFWLSCSALYVSHSLCFITFCYKLLQWAKWNNAWTDEKKYCLLVFCIPNQYRNYDDTKCSTNGTLA